MYYGSGQDPFELNIWPKLKFNWLSIPGPFLIFSPFCSEVKVKKKKAPWILFVLCDIRTRLVVGLSG